MEEIAVLIIGAGPAGLTTSVCLSQFSIPNIILEKEDCCASLWKKRTYDRLRLHLANEFCSLPFSPHPSAQSEFMTRDAFIQYLDDYVSNFKLNPSYFRCVESAFYDKSKNKWYVEAKNTMSDDIEVYVSDFLVLATGENDEPYVPPLPGLSSFHGETIHSREYKSAKRYKDKRVLVVGKGNSGMEIAYDLSNFGAKASIVIRSPFHVMTKEIIYLGMLLLKNMPTQMVDNIIDSIASHVYGDLSKYGIQRPDKGPFYHKIEAGRSPVIDVGTIGKIKAEEIQVFPAIRSITEKKVVFENGAKQEFDVIIFATGYKTIAKNWLKDYKSFLNSDGTPKKGSLNHWKGENGLYCAGFSRMGLAGISKDAKDIAKDIKMIISSKVEKLH